MNKIPLDVLYEDNHLLIVNKPAGLLTQPNDEGSDSLENRGKLWLKEKYQKPGNVFLSVAHRLDKPVSGVVVCAKTSKALSRLNASMRSKELTKTYLALVQGSPKQSAGTLENYLKQDEHRAYTCNANDKDAKLARLHYKVLKSYPGASLLEIILETGRYHQIRCQCAAAGFPIIGDIRYGAKPHASIPREQIALHHVKLQMKHPVSNAELTFEAPLPSEWAALYS